jgi:hypothetical protein
VCPASQQFFRSSTYFDRSSAASHAHIQLARDAWLISIHLCVCLLSSTRLYPSRSLLASLAN